MRKGEKREGGMGKKREMREKEWKSDKLLMFSVNLDSSAHPSQYSLHDSAVFPSSVGTIKSTLNSILKSCYFQNSLVV